jgi:hypothetical protein
MRLVPTAAALLLLSQSSMASSKECPPPPVASAAHATCLGLQYFESPTPSSWELGCEAREQGSAWLVRCTPRSSGVRGGGGEVEVEKLSGKVKLILGYR